MEAACLSVANGPPATQDMRGAESLRVVVEQPPSPDSTQSKNSSESSPIQEKNRIFVAKIPRTVTEEEFTDYFSKYGKIVDAYMPKDRTQRYYRGIGFITFEGEDSASEIMAGKHRFHDQDVVVDFAMPPKKEQTANATADKQSKKKMKEGAASPQSVLPPAQAPSETQTRQAKQTKERVNCSFGVVSDIAANTNNLQSCAKTYVSRERERHLPFHSAYPCQWPQVTGPLDAYNLRTHSQELSRQSNYLSKAAPQDNLYWARNANQNAPFQSLLEHSPSFASTNDLLGALHDGFGDQMSTGTLSQDSDFAHVSSCSQVNFQDKSPMTSLSTDDLIQAFCDMPNSSPPNAYLEEFLPDQSVQHQMAAAMRCSQDSQIMRALYGGGYGNQNINNYGIDPMDYSRSSVNGLIKQNFAKDFARGSHARMASLPVQCAGLNNNILVGHLPSGVSKWDLVDYFNQFGIVADVRMPFGWDSQSRNSGLAYVSFYSQDCVERVIAFGLHRIKNCPVAVLRTSSTDPCFPNIG